MTDSPAPSDRPLGERLRTRRKRLRLTMQQVADGAGLSVGFISQIERGLTVPSLSSLVSIARVLGEPVGNFLDQPADPGVFNPRQQRQLYAIAGSEVSYERISSRFEGSQLRSVIAHEPPGHRGEPIAHAGEELIYVLSGELTAEVDGNRRILRAGDAIHFASTLTHFTWNHTDETTVMLWCGTMDVFGDAGSVPIHGRDAPAAARKPAE